MFKRILNIVILVLIWAAVIAYSAYAIYVVRSNRASQCVKDVVLEIADSSFSKMLVTPAQIKEWIETAGIRMEGSQIDSVDLYKIRETIMSHGFIRNTDVYTTHSGYLHIDVSQCSPILRLHTDGYDSYITGDGYVFPVPEHSALYVPIITGNYSPLFNTDFEGYFNDDFNEKISEIKEEISQTALSIRHLLYGIDTLKAERRKARNQSIKKGFRESKEDFRSRKEMFDEGRRAKTAWYDGIIRDRYAKRNSLEELLESQRNELKKAVNRHNDFWNLVNFVKLIRGDRLLNAEVVQIIADFSSANTPMLEIIPRSGNHRVIFGEVKDLDSKIHKWIRFYSEGLGNLGWDKYSTINLSFKDQVVCTPKDIGKQ